MINVDSLFNIDEIHPEFCHKVSCISLLIPNRLKMRVENNQHDIELLKQFKQWCLNYNPEIQLNLEGNVLVFDGYEGYIIQRLKDRRDYLFRQYNALAEKSGQLCIIPEPLNKKNQTDDCSLLIKEILTTNQRIRQLFIIVYGKFCELTNDDYQQRIQAYHASIAIRRFYLTTDKKKFNNCEKFCFLFSNPLKQQFNQGLLPISIEMFSSEPLKEIAEHFFPEISAIENSYKMVNLLTTEKIGAMFLLQAKLKAERDKTSCYLQAAQQFTVYMEKYYKSVNFTFSHDIKDLEQLKRIHYFNLKQSPIVYVMQSEALCLPEKLFYIEQLAKIPHYETLQSNLQRFDKNNGNPLQCAIKFNRPAIAECLIRLGAKDDKHRIHGSLLHDAVRVNSFEMVATLFRYNLVDINAETDHGERPLHLATDVSIARFLIFNGANANMVTKNGDTLLKKLCAMQDMVLI